MFTMAGKRGTYAKTAARREEILNTALEVIAKEGYSKASLKQVAEAVGLSQMGVLHHFNTKEELLVEVLNRRDTMAFGHGRDADTPLTAESLYEITHQSNSNIGDLFVSLARENSETPGLIQLFTRLLAEGTEEGHTAHDFFQNRLEKISTYVKLVVQEEQKRGIVSPDLDPNVVAVSFTALMDGLQTLWLYNPEIDMSAHIQMFWQLVRNK